MARAIIQPRTHAPLTSPNTELLTTTLITITPATNDSTTRTTTADWVTLIALLPPTAAYGESQRFASMLRLQAYTGCNHPANGDVLFSSLHEPSLQSKVRIAQTSALLAYIE
ncbi:hypothetical protein NW756_009144 [Fusarium oxysporum]|nr:hypothetical protein NW753_013957 [Fusarium oxysporum]KAJ4041708.1 hypothetical protein NW763_012031 [Fusarium oxysporum]KAJ4084279.1 hypothetical protein NW756_009144 [Fusarium oxysporum]WKT49647.1 hypothetical protein QSH57_014594 [Fusarium oxysporum f. sp. vasinfectum]